MKRILKTENQGKTASQRACLCWDSWLHIRLWTLAPRAQRAVMELIFVGKSGLPGVWGCESFKGVGLLCCSGKCFVLNCTWRFLFSPKGNWTAWGSGIEWAKYRGIMTHLNPQRLPSHQLLPPQPPASPGEATWVASCAVTHVTVMWSWVSPPNILDTSA